MALGTIERESQYPSGYGVAALLARASTRTTLLAIALAIASLAVLRWINVAPTATEGALLTWWSIALISIAAELMVFDVEFRKEVYSFTLSEIPLVLGLFFASPKDFVIGRLLGEAIFLIAKERQPLKKLVLNLASFLGECTILLVVYAVVSAGSPIEQPRAWLDALIAVCMADLLGFLVVAQAVKWHGGPLQLRSILAIGAFTAPINTSLALVAGILLRVEPLAALLLVPVAGFLVLTYRSYSALRQRFDSLNMLYDFTRLVSGAQRPEVVLAAILEQAKNLLRAERAEIWLRDDQGCLGLAVDDNGRHNRQLPPDTNIMISEWFSAAPGTSLWTTATNDPRLMPVTTLLGVKECIVSPVTEAGMVVGLLAVVNRLGDSEFRAQDAPMFATLANHASVALENGRLIDRLNEQARQREHESLHDALTGLPNRVLFGTRLAQEVGRLDQQSPPIAVAVMDLDGFKEINDTLGHQSGDRVLVEAAKRIREVVDRDVLVARLGGDEFALLLPNATDSSALIDSGHTIRAELARPMTIDGVRITLGISIGLAIGPADGTDAALLLQRADVAMYGAKAGTGEGVNFYRPDADTNTTRRLALLNDLSTALTHHELYLVYQPKVRFDDGHVTGFEGLLRWKHPTFGNVAPDEFIPLAERSGMIQQVTDFVLRSALRDLQSWTRQGHNWGVAINLSMRNLLDASLVSTVAQTLGEANVDPSRVTLEITESNVMADAERTISVLRELAALGVRLSVDDFGTGYSSLSYLQRLPVHEIKIDKSFVLPLATDASAEQLVRTILDLARNMRLNVVAEGIEDRDSWNRLRQLGCDEGQGYFVARPAAFNEVPQRLRRIEALCVDDVRDDLTEHTAGTRHAVAL